MHCSLNLRCAWCGLAAENLLFFFNHGDLTEDQSDKIKQTSASKFQSRSSRRRAVKTGISSVFIKDPEELSEEHNKTENAVFINDPKLSVEVRLKFKPKNLLMLGTLNLTSQCKKNTYMSTLL
jgi:hypothetical protein